MEISLLKKEKGLFCCAYGCNQNPNPRKGGLCSKHYGRILKKRDPVYDRYKNFKNNALRRQKEFTITLQEFRFFCERTGYILQKGRRGRAATIDRRCNAQGYHIWNIQLLTMRQNIRKYFEHDRILDDCPF